MLIIGLTLGDSQISMFRMGPGSSYLSFAISFEDSEAVWLKSDTSGDYK
jgi:hypothetical protein